LFGSIIHRASYSTHSGQLNIKHPGPKRL